MNDKEVKFLKIRLSAGVHMALKIQAVTNGLSMQDFLEKIITEYIKKNK